MGQEDVYHFQYFYFRVVNFILLMLRIIWHGPNFYEFLKKELPSLQVLAQGQYQASTK